MIDFTDTHLHSRQQSDNQKKSVIINNGGRLQTSEVIFSNNAANVSTGFVVI